MGRQFYITSTAAYGRKGPAAIMTTRTAHAAAQAFAEAFAPGATLGTLRHEPTQTDSAGRLMTWHRAELIHGTDTQSIAPHVVWVREQIGGFDAPALTLADLTA